MPEASRTRSAYRSIVVEKVRAARRLVTTLGLIGGVACTAPEQKALTRDREAPAGNQRIDNYRAAKGHLRELYRTRPRTIYCDCPYNPDEMQVVRGQCGYRGSGGLRVNWEHVVPASHLGRTRKAWRSGDPQCTNEKGRQKRGRSCARRVDPLFNRMEADLYNLYPSLMTLNQVRGSIPPNDVPGEQRRFGDCDFEVQSDGMEPPPSMLGDVARTYLYMDAAYPFTDFLDARLEGVLTRWAADDPVDRAECDRARRIADIQGNENPFVARPCRDNK